MTHAMKIKVALRRKYRQRYIKPDGYPRFWYSMCGYTLRHWTPDGAWFDIECGSPFYV